MNENKNTTYQSLWDSVEAVLRRKYVPVTAVFKRRDLKHNPTSYVKQIEKEQTKPKPRKRKDIRAEINETEDTKTIEKPRPGSLQRSTTLTNLYAD